MKINGNNPPLKFETLDLGYTILRTVPLYSMNRKAWETANIEMGWGAHWVSRFIFELNELNKFISG